MSSFCLAIQLDPHCAILALEATVILKVIVLLGRKEKIQTGVGAFLYLHLVAT